MNRTVSNGVPPLASKARRRIATGQWHWDQARNVAGRYETAGDWEGRQVSVQLVPVVECLPKRTTVADAIRALLTNGDTANANL